jgi:hypothetical protein
LGQYKPNHSTPQLSRGPLGGIMKVKQEQLEQYDWVFSDYIDRVKVKYAPKIGRFLIEFSSLEHTLDIATINYISDRSHDLGYLILEGNSLYNKIELFRKLSRDFTMLTRPQRVKRPEGIVKRLHEIRVFRNYISHANWSTLERTGYVRTKVVEKDAEILFKKVRITPKVIDAWTRRVERLDERLYDFAETQNDF